jgi:hypothetical protein
MPFFNLLRRQAFRPSWEYTTKGILWRLQPASGGMLVGEERDIETRTASFFCVDLSDGRSLWKEQTYGEQWWTGIETVYRDTLLLHGYASPDMPEHRGITGVDVATGTFLWSNSELTCVATLQGNVRAARTLSGAALQCELDRRTGAIIREIGPDTGGSTLPGRGNDEVLSDVLFPVILPEGAAGDSELSLLFREANLADSIAGPVEYVDIGDRIIVGFHEHDPASTKDAPRYRSLLAVIQRTQRALLFRVTIDEAVSFPAPDAFLVIGETLLFVRGRRTLTAIPVRT